MKIKVLEYFITLAEAKSINEAAQKLYISQPSLTKALQLFEKEIGMPLFYRTQTGITLTEAGEKILPEAKLMVQFYNGWLELPKQDILKTVDVYTHVSLSGFLFPDIILHFKEKYSDLNINYTTAFCPEDQLTQNLCRPTLALTVCKAKNENIRTTALAGYERILLLRGEYGCLVNRKGPLADKISVKPEELNDHFFIAPKLQKLNDIPKFVPAVLANKDFLQKTVQVETVGNVIDLLQKYPKGYVLTCWPSCWRYPGVIKGDLIYLPFYNYETNVDICLFYPKQAYQQYPILQKLVNTVKEEAQQFLSQKSPS